MNRIPKRTFLALTLLLLPLLLLATLQEPTRANPNTITVVDAFDPPDATFTYCDVAKVQPRVACDVVLGTGKGAEDGWIDVRGMGEKQVVIRVVTLGATELQFIVEGRIELTRGTNTFSQATADLIAPIDVTATGNGQVFRFIEQIDQLRIGSRESVGSGADSVFIVFDGF